MDWPEFPTDKPSPRKELQGPRPTPLRVRKDSHKIKKPPIAPQASQPHQQQQQQYQQQQQQYQQPQQLRQPVIIYTISPKVIHTNASDFMSLVQRLTGPSSSSSPIPPQTSSSSPSASCGAISPAARFATVEKTKLSPEADKFRHSSYDHMDMMDMDMDMLVQDFDIGPSNVERTGPGILSPLPSSLPIISPSFFSPPSSDHNPFNFLHDLSPMIQANKNYFENVFAPSPGSTFLQAPITSPNLSFDLYNQFLDF